VFDAAADESESMSTHIKWPDRRMVLRFAAAGTALGAVRRSFAAGSYPNRAVRIVVGFAPGGGNDITARIVGQRLSEKLNQPFIVENRAGAGTNIATELVLSSAPDGYTLLLAGIPNAVNATMYKDLKFNFIRDVTPIVGISSVPNVMLLRSSFPATTLAAFVEYAKANPGKVNMASPGTGSGGHLSGELFKYLTHVDLTHVPFRGNGPALTALLGGDVDVLFPPISASLPYIKSGQLNAIGITGSQRTEVLPGIPSINEVVKGYDMVAWYGLAAPKSVGRDVVDRINAETNSVLAEPAIKDRIAEQGGTIIGGTAEAFEALIAAETAKWEKVVRAAQLSAG
jgi:tripartite-type tricarboxylate transporter receptor subunit TctC